MQIKYKDKIVAFIDVLGFSNIVYSNTTQLINQYFNYVLEDFKGPVKENNFDYYLISDSIVITADNTKENLKAMIELTCLMQSKLMMEGILLRGGISCGNLYLNKTKGIIVGTGLINAYKLEPKAVYPRVIIDRCFITKYFTDTKSTKAFLKNTLFNFLISSPPVPYIADFLYIDYLRFFCVSAKRYKYDKAMQLIKQYYYKNEHIEKYEWLRVHFLYALLEQYNFLKQQIPPTKSTRKAIRLIEEVLEEVKKL